MQIPFSGFGNWNERVYMSRRERQRIKNRRKHEATCAKNRKKRKKRRKQR